MILSEFGGLSWVPNGDDGWGYAVVRDTSTFADRVEALLGAEFGGLVGSDRWSVYRRFPAERRALCWAHLKREF